VHPAEHLARLDEPRILTPTRLIAGHCGYARRSVGAALEALKCRPGRRECFQPHAPAGPSRPAEPGNGLLLLEFNCHRRARSRRTGATVAVFDFDVHHGNGTEAILLNVRDGFLFFLNSPISVLSRQRCDDVGGNCFNYPVAVHRRARILRCARTALDELKSSSRFGGGFRRFDATRAIRWRREHSRRKIFTAGQSLRRLRRAPVISLLEGGYSSDLRNSFWLT